MCIYVPIYTYVVDACEKNLLQSPCLSMNKHLYKYINSINIYLNRYSLMCVCVCIHKYIHTYIHTYTHTHWHAPAKIHAVPSQACVQEQMFENYHALTCM